MCTGYLGICVSGFLGILVSESDGGDVNDGRVGLDDDDDGDDNDDDDE